MRLDHWEILRTATAVSFQRDSVEKVVHLQRLLHDIFRHPYLRDRLVLKGGTAINLFYFDLARLSVDIDLNYIGKPQRDDMMQERPHVEYSLRQIISGHDYRIQEGKEAHAGHKFYLNYEGVGGGRDRVEVDVNYQFRVSLLEPRMMESAAIHNDLPCTARVLQLEELFAGKMHAFLDRRHPRDLFDLHNLVKRQSIFDWNLWRKLTTAFVSCLPSDMRRLTPDRLFSEFSDDTLALLYQTLRHQDRPSIAEMIATVHPLVEELLSFDSNEESFLNGINEGEIRADLLFPDNPDMAERLLIHPALQWKVDNVREHRRAGKNRSQG